VDKQKKLTAKKGYCLQEMLGDILDPKPRERRIFARMRSNLKMKGTTGWRRRKKCWPIP